MNLRLYDTDDHESLAIHMMFFHGIGILLATAAHHSGTVFEGDGFEALVGHIEALPQVSHIKQKLMQVSFFGLRNVHSYDHQETERLLVDHHLKQVDYSAKMPVGSQNYLGAMEKVQEYGAGQPMQCSACLKWLTSCWKGIDQLGAEQLVQTAERVLYESAGEHVMHIRWNLLQPQYAGSGDLLRDWTPKDFDAMVIDSPCNGEAKCCLAAVIDWGASFWGTDLKVPILDEDTCTTLRAEAEGNKAQFLGSAQPIAEEYVRSGLSRHRSQVRAIRLKVWGAELADWWLKVSGFDEVFADDTKAKTVLGLIK